MAPFENMAGSLTKNRSIYSVFDQISVINSLFCAEQAINGLFQSYWLVTKSILGLFVTNFYAIFLKFA